MIWTNWEEEVIKAEQRLGRGRGRSGCIVFEDEKKKECSSCSAAVALLEMEEGKKKEEEDDALRISVVEWTEKPTCTISLGRTEEGKVPKVHHKQDSCSTEEEEEEEEENEEEESKEDKVDSSLTRSPVSSFIRVASF